MGIGVAILTAIVVGAIVSAVVFIVYLTAKKLKQFLKERLERKRKSKVAFGETRKIMDKHARVILENAPSMTMEELENFCEETPYFVVDYDSSTGEVSDYTTIKTNAVDEKIEDLMSENDGIILFN